MKIDTHVVFVAGLVVLCLCVVGAAALVGDALGSWLAMRAGL